MQLRDYLTREGLTLEQFGARIERSAATISRIVRGLNRPDWETMLAIERESGGEVQPNDFTETRAAPETGEAA